MKFSEKTVATAACLFMFSVHLELHSIGIDVGKNAKYW